MSVSADAPERHRKKRRLLPIPRSRPLHYDCGNKQASPKRHSEGEFAASTGLTLEWKSRAKDPESLKGDRWGRPETLHGASDALGQSTEYLSAKQRGSPGDWGKRRLGVISSRGERQSERPSCFRSDWPPPIQFSLANLNGNLCDAGVVENAIGSGEVGMDSNGVPKEWCTARKPQERRMNPNGLKTIDVPPERFVCDQRKPNVLAVRPAAEALAAKSIIQIRSFGARRGSQKSNPTNSESARSVSAVPTVPPLLFGFTHSAGEIHIVDGSQTNIVSCPGHDNKNCATGNSLLHISVQNHLGPYFDDITFGGDQCSS
ncbi:hypothetical protein B0H16DRAFT_1467121 [Mycena metata]|uniref:Uncharacterized protein n=1 Tax=Mycena metata TaxID=1033252 RepID=A0AAD7I5N3_9AGAR|nr:hypothetical protein B0H16DRAFT_1467121 [Mycena metata]